MGDEPGVQEFSQPGIRRVGRSRPGCRLRPGAASPTLEGEAAA
ncbi:hypothetical protein ABZ845_16920 [Streptomyces sp. NPDC047022]